MIKVVQFDLTTGGEKFKEFLAKQFTVDMLSPVFNEKSCEKLFEGWHGKNMNNWHKFTNDDGFILEFYPDYYITKKPVGKLKLVLYQLPLPQTINDFVNDMHRFNIDLYWTNWIDENFEPKDYLNKNEIEKYYNDLLTKMGKIDEIN